MRTDAVYFVSGIFGITCSQGNEHALREKALRVIAEYITEDPWLDSSRSIRRKELREEVKANVVPATATDPLHLIFVVEPVHQLRNTQLKAYESRCHKIASVLHSRFAQEEKLSGKFVITVVL